MNYSAKTKGEIIRSNLTAHKREWYFKMLSIIQMIELFRHRRANMSVSEARVAAERRRPAFRVHLDAGELNTSLPCAYIKYVGAFSQRS